MQYILKENVNMHLIFPFYILSMYINHFDVGSMTFIPTNTFHISFEFYSKAFRMTYLLNADNRLCLKTKQVRKLKSVYPFGVKC